MKKLRKLGSAGDTIVEVLFAMAILGVVLGGAYAAASRSLQASRAAQERGEALKLVEGQIERAKAIASDTTKDLFKSTDKWCINGALDVVSSTDTDCIKQNGLYDLWYVYDNDPNKSLFQFNAEWDRIGGGEKEKLTVSYQLFR